MLRSKTYLQLLYALAWVLWPMVTWAASVTLSNTINEIPVSAWVIVFILSAVSGLVSLLQRLKDEMMKPKWETQIYRAWRWFTAAHIIGALFAGLIAFLVAEAFDITDLIEAVFIAVMAYGGARVTDKMADGISDGIVNRVIGLVGGNPPKKDDA